MLNLLFISDSPKVEHLKGLIQPLLKVIIDVVTDFDLGLKDIFEKRPATVCIQEQIGGVTGESVARHIQMLLGNSAPTFILLHTGNDKARPIKGLYDHLIDLSQSNDALAEELKSMLKLQLGDQWERIYIPPKRTPASVRLSVAVPEESREDADRLVDDFLSDLESSGLSVVDVQPLVASVSRKVTKEPSGATRSETPRRPVTDAGTVESDRAQAINDDLAELLRMESDKERRDERPAAVPSEVVDEPGSVSVGLPKPAPAVVKTSPAAAIEMSSGKTSSAKSAVSAPGRKNNVVASSSATTAPPQAAAEFRIKQDARAAEDQIPEDLPLEFDQNYRTESFLARRTVAILLVSALCVAGGWYLARQNPQLTYSLRQRLFSSSEAKQAPVAVPSPIPSQNPVPPAVPQPIVVPLLPAFIPIEGHDTSYAVKNPGWERYIGKRAEFRVFSAAGRIQAVQVLAVKDAPVAESLLKSVLQEIAGTSEYLITSRNTKAGIRVENGNIKNKGEIVIYRKNVSVKAFVVSVN